jgi:hypothetical protein
LVRLHGGDMSIKSRIGQGTRVTVRLPLDCERAEPATISTAPQPAGVVSYLATAPTGGANAAVHGERADTLAEILPQPRREDTQVRKSA